MTNKLKAKVIATHSNHAFIKNPFLIITDHDVIEDFMETLLTQRNWGFLDYFHMNHFVLECEGGLYIGFNDKAIYVGTEFTELEETETSKASFNLTLGWQHSGLLA